MAKVVCSNCGHIITDGMYCEHCGTKVRENTDILKQSEIRKNPFGLLSMFTFLATIFFFTAIPFALSLFKVTLSWMKYGAYIGYALSIILEIIGMMISRKDKSIDVEASGMNYGGAAMVFSFLMMLVTLVYV